MSTPYLSDVFKALTSVNSFAVSKGDLLVSIRTYANGTHRVTGHDKKSIVGYRPQNHLNATALAGELNVPPDIVKNMGLSHHSYSLMFKTPALLDMLRYAGLDTVDYSFPNATGIKLAVLAEKYQKIIDGVLDPKDLETVLNSVKKDMVDVITKIRGTSSVFKLKLDLKKVNNGETIAFDLKYSLSSKGYKTMATYLPMPNVNGFTVSLNTKNFPRELTELDELLRIMSYVSTEIKSKGYAVI